MEVLANMPSGDEANDPCPPEPLGKINDVRTAPENRSSPSVEHELQVIYGVIQTEEYRMAIEPTFFERGSRN